MTPESTADLVARARQRCIAAHAGQKRDNGADYATHPQAVAGILRDHGVSDPAVLAAAYLHDVLEDTSTTEAELGQEFGTDVVGLVLELTNIVPPRAAFAEKQAALIEHARRMSPRAKLVKLADRLHNLGEMIAWPQWKQVRYANAALELLEALQPVSHATLADRVRAAAAACITAQQPG